MKIPFQNAFLPLTAGYWLCTQGQRCPFEVIGNTPGLGISGEYSPADVTAEGKGQGQRPVWELLSLPAPGGLGTGQGCASDLGRSQTLSLQRP